MSQGRVEHSPLSAPTPARGSLLDALDFKWPEVDPISAEYQVTAALALMFIIIQFALLAAIAAFLIRGLWLMGADFSRSPILCFWGIVADALVLLFLLKPFILRPHRESADCEQAVSRHDEPRLYDFIAGLCRRIDATPPDVINLSLDAGARVRLTTFITGRTELTLGLPLLSVFPVRVLIAILGHELSRCRQSGTLRLTGVTGHLRRLIERVLYQRDAVDIILDNLRSVRNAYFSAVKWVIIIVVELMRGLLWLLMVGGLWMICVADRQMELDADRFAASLVGRDEMIQAIEREHLLAIGVQQVTRDVNTAPLERALPDDLVQLIAAETASLARFKDDAPGDIDRSTMRWCSSHPSLSDRIENLSDIDNRPSVGVDISGTELLADFTAASRRLTSRFYDQRLGELRKRFAMISAKKLGALRAGSRCGEVRVRRYFRTGVGPSRRMLPGCKMLKPADDVPAAMAKLKEMRAALSAMHEKVDMESGPELEVLMRNRTILRGHLNAMEQMMSMVWKVHRHANLSGVRRWRRQLVRDAAKIEKRISALSETVGWLDALAQRRLRLVMSLLYAPVHLPTGTDLSPLQARASSIAHMADALNRVCGLVVQMRDHVNTLDIFCRDFSPAIRRVLAEPVHLTAKALVENITEFCHEFSARAELVATAKEQAAIGRVLPLPVTDPNNLGELRQCALAAEDYLNPIIKTLQAHTAILAEDVESALGLEILPDPPRELEARCHENFRTALKVDMKYWLFNGFRAAGGLVALIFVIHLVMEITSR